MGREIAINIVKEHIVDFAVALITSINKANSSKLYAELYKNCPNFIAFEAAVKRYKGLSGYQTEEKTGPIKILRKTKLVEQ